MQILLRNAVFQPALTLAVVVFPYLHNVATAKPRPAAAKAQSNSSFSILSPRNALLKSMKEQVPKNRFSYPSPLGVSPSSATSVPFEDICVGAPEHPGGQNRMRRQVALGPAGTVHFVYPVYADSPEIDGAYFYNAFNCFGSDGLQFTCLEKQVRVAPPPPDSPKVFSEGGLFIPAGNNTPVIYGRRRELGAFSQRVALVKDQGECLGLFAADTPTVVGSSFGSPVMYAVNETLWIATYQGASPSGVWVNRTTDAGLTWSSPVLATQSIWVNATAIAGSENAIYIVSHADPNDPGAFQTTERPVYVKSTDGGATWSGISDPVGTYEQPNYLANGLGIEAQMVGDTLHVIWTDWNNYNGNGFPGPGGHVHHLAVEPNGTLQGPHKIADINIDGRLPDRSYTNFGFAIHPWMNVSLSYRTSPSPALYALWSCPPDDGGFGWGDYNASYTLACFDIFSSASDNNGRSWDDPVNLTQTSNPGCTSGECYHEDYFSAAEKADSVIYVLSLLRSAPGFQQLAINSGIPKDPGSVSLATNRWRLYRAPARNPVASIRADLRPTPPDTTLLHRIHLQPRVENRGIPLRLSNLGLAGFFLDSLVITGALNDGFLSTTHNAAMGTFLPEGGGYDFTLTFNTENIGSSEQGVRSGLLLAYLHTPETGFAPVEKQIALNLTVYIMHTLCLNRRLKIHSANNSSDIGIQGTVADGAGFGMYYPLNEHSNIYDGGIWIANPALSGQSCTGSRKVSRQNSPYDRYLQCVADGILDSAVGTDTSYHNLFLKSIGTDIDDSGLVWQSIWEQSTHSDSSDFLIQTTRVINIDNAPIDSVAMGIWYDIDVDVSGTISAGANVGGDTTVNHLGRTWWLGWITGNDVVVDSCSPGPFAYGFVVIPGSIGNPGDTVRPRGAVVYEQSGFWEPCFISTDSLDQRISYNLNVLTSTRDREHDTLTGVYEDTLGGPPYFICGDPNTGPPWRADMAYLAIAKKVYNFPVNGGGQAIAARYGLEGLAASVDTFFSGPGETYTVIHVASSGGGISELMANAVTAIDWYVNHANLQVGTRQTRLKGDLNDDSELTPADVVEALQYIFLGEDISAGRAIPTCAGDLNNDGGLTPADVVILLNAVFLGTGCPNCLQPCI